MVSLVNNLKFIIWALETTCLKRHAPRMQHQGERTSQATDNVQIRVKLTQVKSHLAFAQHTWDPYKHPRMLINFGQKMHSNPLIWTQPSY